MKTTFNEEVRLTYLQEGTDIPTMFMPIVHAALIQKFRVSIFSTGSAELLYDAVEQGTSYGAVRQKYLNEGFAAHQLSIMRVTT